eukprot:s3200_g2.t3
MKAATLRSSYLLLWLLLHCTDSRSPGGGAEFTLAGKSVYFIVIDRFARSGEQAANFTFCDLPADWVNNTGGGFCGGTINGITNRLDYIQGMGFDCLWITPPVQSQGFMGYDATNLFQINPHFGTKDDLVRLSAALHSRGMCLIVDIVLNHMRCDPETCWPLLVKGTVNLSSIVPFNSESHYHQRNRSTSQSFADYVAAWPPPAFNPGEDNSQLLAASQQDSPACVCVSIVTSSFLWVVGEASPQAVCGHTVADHTECSCFPGNSGPNCPSFREDHLSTGWLGVMGDLNQSHEYVRAQLLSFVEGMVVNYSLDALRLDTAIYLQRDFLPEVQAVAGVEILGEATVNNLTYQASLMQGPGRPGLAGLLNFPPFYKVPEAFCAYQIGGDFGDYSHQGTWFEEADLEKLGGVLSLQLSTGLFGNPDMLGNFVDNHDEYGRLDHYCRHDTLRIRHALAFAMLWRGIPIIYYGTEQGLSGHQSPDHNLGQDALRESLWQTRYSTDPWQYRFLALLNGIRKSFGISVGDAQIRNATKTSLVFTRAGSNGAAWVFLNNAANATARSPQRYCPGPDASQGEAWYDALSELPMSPYLVDGCFLAPDKFPKVLVLKTLRLLL